MAQHRDRASEFQPAEDVVALYTDGWLYRKREIDWIAHAFFGALMKRDGVDLVLEQSERPAELIPGLEGVFFVDDDEGGPSRRWDVTGGRVSVR